MKYSLIVIFFLSGCSLISPSIEEDYVSQDISHNISIPEQKVTPSHAVSYYDEPLVNNVNDYAKWLIQDLFASIDLPSNDEIFMVTDLAILDSDLNKTNLFGRQLSEAMLHEVHQTGFSIIDIRSTGYVRFSEQGDIFSQSRDYLELDSNIEATNIITGTLTRHRGGYLLNARAVGLSSKMLVASAQIFVPFAVVDSVIQEELTTKNVTKIIEDTPVAKKAVPEQAGIPIQKYKSRK